MSALARTAIVTVLGVGLAQWTCQAAGRLSLPGAQARQPRTGPATMHAALRSSNRPDPLFAALIHTLERGLDGQRGGRSPFDDAYNLTRSTTPIDSALARKLVTDFRSAVAGRSYPSVPGSVASLRADSPFVPRLLSGATGRLAGAGTVAVNLPLAAMSETRIIAVEPEAPMGYKRGQTIVVSGANLVMNGWTTSVHITKPSAIGSWSVPGVPKPEPETVELRKSDLIGLAADGFRWKIPLDFVKGASLLTVRLTKNQRAASGTKPEVRSDSAYIYVEVQPPGQPVVGKVGDAAVGKKWIIDVQRLQDAKSAQSVLMKPLEGQKLWYSWKALSGEKVGVLMAQTSYLNPNRLSLVIPLNFPPGRYQMAVNSKSYGHSPWREVLVRPLRASVRLQTLRCLSEWQQKIKDDYIVTICVANSGRNVQVSVLDPIGPYGDGMVRAYPNPASAVFGKGGGTGELHGDLHVGLCIARWPKGVATFAQRGLQPIADLAGRMAAKSESLSDAALGWSVLDSVSKLVVWAGGDVLLSQTYKIAYGLEDMFVTKAGQGKWDPARSRKLASEPTQGTCLYEIAYQVIPQQ